MNILSVFISFLLILGLQSCSQRIQSTSVGDYHKIAKNKFNGENGECTENESHTFVLCKHEANEPGSPYKTWEYFVYDLKQNIVILDDVVDKGNVKWYNTMAIEVSKVPGTMAEGQTMADYAWIVDVVSGEKIRKSEYLDKEDR